MAGLQKSSMHCLLVFATVIGTIYCQQLKPVVPLPDYDQYNCIFNAMEDEALNIAEDCAGETILDVSECSIFQQQFCNIVQIVTMLLQISALCNMGTCYHRFSRIFSLCNYTGLEISK